MYTKMNATPGHFNRCGIDVHDLSITQNNAHMCGTTYLTLDSGLRRGNITHSKWERS
jgi:hypothetical protein